MKWNSAPDCMGTSENLMLLYLNPMYSRKSLVDVAGVRVEGRKRTMVKKRRKLDAMICTRDDNLSYITLLLVLLSILGDHVRSVYMLRGR